MTNIMWCALCNAAPWDGMLEILRDGDTETVTVPACAGCVNGIPKEGWLMNKDLSGSHE